MISITHPTARDMALYAVYLVVVIDIFASALSVPIMPFYVRDLCGCESMDAAASCADPVCNRLGGATASLGFMFSSFAIAQLISNAWLGPLSDAVGRKAILTLTLSGACIGAFASGLAPSYSWLVAARIFIGFCSGTMSTANAYIADISSIKERPTLMANMGTLLQLCFMFGPGVGAGLAELDRRAPFWVSAGTAVLALLIVQLYIRPPDEIFVSSEPTHEVAATGEKTGEETVKEDAAGQDPPQTDWGLIAVLALGALGSNTAMASLLTCQALYLQHLFGFGSLQFGFVMMGTATFSILVRLLIFSKVQTALGLMPTAVLGALMGTVTYVGYSTLDGSRASMYIFFALAGVGTVGSTFTGASVTPFFSQLGNRKNMGRVMSVSSMASSAGRVIGPPVFGALYSINPRFPYRVAALCTIGAAAVYALVALRTRPKSEVRPATPLAERDAARAMSLKRTPSGLEAQKVANATAELQELLAMTLQQRGYDLGNAAVVELLKQLLVDVLPVRADGCTDEQVLGAGMESVPESWSGASREHAHCHPHHA
uniref:Major facilitator superfamily (MFS) profile domain-containing protein n=1 Tax=Phaeocystis antarctica TaxID=33657 RepID=A0A7S0DZB9_9EUKA|mmetsp:Transcript_10857/g.25593  ORF Transcript_10857/g.25593 Transcript_10857/m.25593 type:complete len:545 (+) Transcript_10857:85-1719(+)